MTASPRRALVAAGLLAALLAALLGAWFTSGWADVSSRQRAVRDAPRLEAEQRGVQLGHELRGELAGVLAREALRPYFHYQNLFHDPRASAVSVAPSPLAQGTRDPQVLGYFQLDARGRATTPTINDDLPELSEPAHLADHRRFRDEVTRSLAGRLAPSATGPRVAQLSPGPARRSPHSPRPAQTVAQSVPQVLELDPSSYAQNARSNSIYVQQRRVPPAAPDLGPSVPDSAASAPDPGPGGADPRRVPAPDAPDPAPGDAGPRRVPAPLAPDPAPGDADPDPGRPVAITVSPLEWRTLPFAGQPTLVAVRQVETPDGRLVQGFVVDRTSVTGWLASHAGDAVAELRTGDGGRGGTEIAPGWQLEVAPNPRAVVAAAAAATGVARGFVARFVAGGVVAIVVALLVVMLVARAERLARERSQFAAAAAHELRTPLAGLQLYGDMLADGLGDPGKLRDYARRMSEEASRLGRVVSNVLGFSQLERGDLGVEVRTAALDPALRELADRARPALDRAGAVLDLDLAPELTARFDRDALARIVGNLVDNAEKYGRGAGDRTITLSARIAGEVVEVAVTDHGPGIGASARGELFRPFARGVDGDGPAGLGLGLALSRSLARAMGGELVYRPAPGGGAAFVLTLARG